MLYVYAISDTRTEPGRPGLHGAPVRGFGAEPPFAIASEHRDSLAHPDEADLWAHERIIEDLMDRSTVLPMRFGSTVPDEASLLKILGERRGEFERLIDRVRGRVELSVRAQVIVAQPVPARSTALADAAGPGTTYLLELREIQGRADDALARIHEPLATLARQSARKTGGLRPGAFKGAYLVDRDRVEEFRARVGQLADEIEGARIVCTGPWPPYSFSAGSPE
jgi:gas vesicle protein GvpL/GvpF